MPGPLTPDQKNEAVLLHLRHESFRSIARQLNSTVPTVKKALLEREALKPPEPDPGPTFDTPTPKLISAPFGHWELLKKLSKDRGMATLSEYIRSIFRKELEAAGALKH